MPCPIMEADKMEKYGCGDCENCTLKQMNERVGDFYSDLADEVYERMVEEGLLRE